MTENRKELLYIAALMAMLIVFFNHVLFTDMIIRAPDLIYEFFWGVKKIPEKSLWELLKIRLTPDWDIYTNSGYTREGGGQTGQFLFALGLIFKFFPLPSSVAWFIVFHFFIAGFGMYCYCRLIGISLISSFIGALIFVLSPELVTLINAGHVMKIATISIAPWGFYFLEKGFKTERVFYFIAAGLLLAFQFFHSHWQIAFYTCLCIAVYGISRSIGILVIKRDDWKKIAPKLVGLNLALMFFFLSTVSMDLLPLHNWSKETNRGVASGSNQGKGGLNRAEAMLWSMPPEEMISFVIPGFFGFSRQEGGTQPTPPPKIKSYYWGRMNMTQTLSYMGLLPWLLLPLPIIFRRDRYTWLAMAAVLGGLFFSMGKYTFIYRFIFDYFPGIDKFRVPKMMMFIVPLGLAVMSARALDVLSDEEVRKSKSFKWYVWGLLSLPIILLITFATEYFLKSKWMYFLGDMIRRPSRFERGQELIDKRWDNLVTETGIALLLATVQVGIFFSILKKWIQIKWAPILLLAIFVCDVWRINEKFTLLVELPSEHRDVLKSSNNSKKTVTQDPLIKYLADESDQFRIIPMDGAIPSSYSSKGIPVFYSPNAVQVQRWQSFINALDLNSSMVDMMNVKHIVYPKSEYEKKKFSLPKKFEPVFNRADFNKVILENKNVLPKGWLVPSVFSLTDEKQMLGALRDNRFDPRKFAIVEEKPPIEMIPINKAAVISDGEVKVEKYKGNEIQMTVKTPQNALLVLGEKFYKGWQARVDGEPAKIYRVNYLLRGVYVTPGEHKVEFVFDPLPFKVGKTLTLSSFAIFLLMLGREVMHNKRREVEVVSQPKKKKKDRRKN